MVLARGRTPTFAKNPLVILRPMQDVNDENLVPEDAVEDAVVAMQATSDPAPFVSGDKGITFG